MFYALNGGLRFVNGYNKVSVWNDNAPIGGTFDAADQSLNVSPMFAVDPRVGAVIGYELGNYDLTASAEYFGSELSFGIGLELATGRHNQAAGAHSLYWGGFVESNQFAMDRAHPWVAEAKLPSDLGSFDLDSTSVGVFVEAVTQSSSFRVGFGTVTSAEARVYRSSHNLGDNGDPSSPNAIMSDGSGHHINVAFSQNVMPVGSGNLRADMEFDYQKLDFNMIEQPNGGNKANKVYTAGTAQVATFAVGPTYSQKVTNGIEAYVGLDYLIGAGRFVMTTTGGDNSNYNAMFEESARVRVGADFSVGSGMGRVEISGNSDAGASVAASYSMTF